MPTAAIVTITIPPSLAPAYHNNATYFDTMTRDVVAAVLGHDVVTDDVRIIEAYTNEELGLDGCTALLTVFVTPKAGRCWSVRHGADQQIAQAVARYSNDILRCFTTVVVSKELTAPAKRVLQMA
jgi:hypothetical protein